MRTFGSIHFEEEEATEDDIFEIFVSLQKSRDNSTISIRQPSRHRPQHSVVTKKMIVAGQ